MYRLGKRPRVIAVALGALVGSVVALPAAGAEGVDPAIVNGNPVSAATFTANWPWIVSLEIVNTDGDAFRCGGSLITDQVVLSAGHCLAEPEIGTVLPSGITVLYGSHDVTTATAVGVTAYATHPGFDPVSLQNDVSILQLASPVPVAPVLLASAGDIPVSGRGAVAGWGQNVAGSPVLPNNLYEARGPIQSPTFCNDVYGGPAFNPDQQICLGTVNPGALDPNTCQGDSGGPLVERGTVETTLIGITSFTAGGSPCGRFPTGFAAVGAFRAFIDPQVNAWDPGGLAPVSPVGTFVPLPPARIHDTRGGATLAAHEIRTFQVTGLGGVPANATTALLNVTAADPQGDGYLTAFPCGGEIPYASNTNYVTGYSNGNVAQVGLSASGTVCVLTWAASDVVIDVQGYWQSASQGTLFNSIPPNRLFDSRLAGRSAEGTLPAGQPINISVAGLAREAISAVALNITAAQPADGGYITAYPCDAPVPPTSNVNFVPGDLVSNGAVVKTSAAQEFCLLASVDTPVVVDITGWFGQTGSTSGGRVSPILNQRVMDTRETGQRVTGGQLLVVPVSGIGAVPANALGVVLNVTAVDTAGDGYLTAFACGEHIPETSTVNYQAGEIVPNLTFTGAGDLGSVCIFSYADADIVVDVTGIVNA